jgi:hypothetical protein
LLDYINAGTPVIATPEGALLESVFSFLSARAGFGLSVATLPGLTGVSPGDVEALDSAIAEAVDAIEIPHAVYARNAGISPLAMQRLLEYFRNKKKQEELLLAPPESQDAAQTYVRALGRTTKYLGAGFGPPGRHFVLAILIADWMRGRPLALLIARRIKYYAERGDDKIASHIRSTMVDVEQVARFEAPKYLGCYNDVLRFHLKSTGRTQLVDEMFDLTMMLELGVSTETELALMTLGLSRTSAIAIAEHIARDDLDRDDCLEWLREHDLGSFDLPVLVRREIEQQVSLASSSDETD